MKILEGAVWKIECENAVLVWKWLNMKKRAAENLKDGENGVRPRMIFTLILILMGFIHDPWIWWSVGKETGRRQRRPVSCCPTLDFKGYWLDWTGLAWPASRMPRQIFVSYYVWGYRQSTEPNQLLSGESSPAVSSAPCLLFLVRLKFLFPIRQYMFTPPN